MTSFSNRCVLLTGATGGIGAALARQLDAEGATLWLVGRDSRRLAALASELGRHGINHHRVGDLDLATEAGRARLIDRLYRAPYDQRPSTVVHLAGINALGWFQEAAPEEISRLVTTNLTATLLLTHALLPLLLEQPRAQLLFVGSVLGHIGHPGYAAYGASKAGLKGFAEALSREFPPSAIRVQYLAPRTTSTAMNGPTAKAMNEALGNTADSPERVAQAIVTQLERGERRRTLGTKERLFCLINSLFPTLVDRGIAKSLPEIDRHLSRSPAPATSDSHPSV
ncbi:SDR family oxidoreductase [Larsenimonas suaedae]|uniref:SDR family oxidoreductase n=1 Tax=Larsenimonas suaedae TaxID=1851019 RepID=A0ABU1GS01_9GAMM|nr:SDR family oxidoreductase [Larsenimonas suaedae]MCM2972404.1 SDR family oxidoreductase [Larsenimonas suaedae]MDR5894800.1 SDR family oxidoreductase [Larsenimonas suaedae]